MSAQPLVEVVRGELVESVHFGSLVLLASDGTVEHAVGDVHSTMFPRSTNKLMQAAGVLELGVTLSSKETAIAASSHSGGDVHVEVVAQLLQRHGLSVEQLRNTAGVPIGATERKAYLSAGGSKSALRADCSGKHAAFLVACQVQGWDLDEYLEDSHPLQQHLKQTLQSATEVSVESTSVDGCGAPLWSSTLVGLARAYRKGVVQEASSPLRRVADAMRAHPSLVAGPGREPTAAMLAGAGVVAKDGAEGVFAMADGQGRAAAFKISDGNKRALAPIAMAVLRHWGVTDDALSAFEPLAVLGGGKPVGRLQVAPSVLPAP